MWLYFAYFVLNPQIATRASVSPQPRRQIYRNMWKIRSDWFFTID